MHVEEALIRHYPFITPARILYACVIQNLVKLAQTIFPLII